MGKLVNNGIGWTGSKNKESFSLPSLTVPSMTKSLKEIAAQYVRGMEIPQFEPEWRNEEEIPKGYDQFEEIDYQRLDAVEKADLALQIKNNIEEYKDSVQRNRQSSKLSQEEELRLFKEKREEFMNWQNQQDNPKE